MSTIPLEFVNKLSGVQNSLWPQVTAAVSEAAGNPLSFGNPLTVVAQTAELHGELNVPMLVIQFAFADLPENGQAILVPQETLMSMASYIQDKEVTEIDENLVSDIRGTLEAIVQGLCIGVGNVKGEPVVASGLSIRYQSFTFPANLTRCHEIMRTQVALTADEVNGTLIWLFDDMVTAYLIGEAAPSEEETQIFGAAPAAAGAEIYQLRQDDGHSLDLLMDIPLEISVELGRVRMMVRDVVELGTGSIVEIEKAAGEPVDVLVNGRPVARGEVVVIEDNFGVRITEILNPQERLAKLSEAA
ncbi:MAG: flagellar motor switch protein FliN [Fimbriimonadales bacterium]